MSHAEVFTYHADELVEITWAVPYSWSKPRPATYLDPPEGGLELDGDPYPTELVVFDDDGSEAYRIRGDELDLFDLAQLIGGIDDTEMWEAAADHQNGEMEYAQECAAEARMEQLRGM